MHHSALIRLLFINKLTPAIAVITAIKIIIYMSSQTLGKYFLPLLRRFNPAEPVVDKSVIL